MAEYINKWNTDAGRQFQTVLDNTKVDQFISKDKLRHFLRSTANSGFTEDERLIVLAHRVDFPAGWKTVCAIYELAEKDEGTFLTWISLAIHKWMTKKNPLSIAEKLQVAKDALLIADKAISMFPLNDGFLAQKGRILKDYPCDPSMRTAYLEQALDCFVKAVELRSANADEIDLENQINLADSLMELQRWAQALRIYQSLDLSLVENESGISIKNEIVEKILICQLRANPST